jgi:phosphoribosyl-ATP pyrophosphohydrolase/phosphoribosyl-AMP cyclohydrolase
MSDINDPQIRWDADGLVPGIVQDARTGDVRMLGYLSSESLNLTVETGQVHFFSRSRQRIWKKGETSGNVLELVSIVPDCDGDTLLIQVIPHGPTCHTGEESCFYAEPLATGEATANVAPTVHVIDDVASVVAARKRDLPEGSYTTYLFNAGVDKIAKKIGEEAAEVIVAAKNAAVDELAWEASDLIYHLLVMLAACDVPVERVYAELAGRRGSRTAAGA